MAEIHEAAEMSAAAEANPGIMVKGQRRERPTLSIATVLALCFGVLVAVGITAVLLIGFLTSGKNTFGLLNQQSVMMVASIDESVREYLQPALDKATFFKNQVANGSIDIDDDSKLENVLLGTMAAAPHIEGVAIFDEDLNQKFAFVGPNGKVQFQTEDARYQEEVMKIAERARSQEDLFWGELFFESERRITYVNVIQPLYFQDQYKGFFGVIVSMPKLSQFVTDVGGWFDATAFILYGDDQVLAHQQLIDGHAGLSEQNPTVGRDKIGDLVLANLEKRYPAGGFDDAAEEGVEVDMLELGSDNHFVVFTAVNNEYGDVPWTIGAYIPADIVGVEIERLVASGVAGVAVLIISVLAAIFLGKKLAQPIRRMAKSAAQVGDLDLASVKPLEPSSIRELKDQATAFNKMLAGLQWFETYVPRTLVRQLIDSGENGELVFEERELTVMFTDIVGFSSMAEQMSPQDAAGLLNDHFQLLGACVEAEGGTIDKYIGDALMAFWGAPDEQPDHAARACRTAKSIVAAIAADNERRREAGLYPVRVRIGIHTGPVVVGNIGATGRINYTIVGDVVNATERLESLGKELDEGHDVTVLMGAETVNEAILADGQAEHVGAFEVKGKAAKLEVFRLKT